MANVFLCGWKLHVVVCKVFIYFQDEIHPNIRKIQCSRNKIGSPLTVR